VRVGNLRLALMAGLSLGLGLAISAAPFAGSAGTSALAASAAPSHVALIVETAPGNVSTACASWHPGMSGLDVLTSGASAVIGQRPPYIGFVLAINGVGSNRPTTSTYWAYYRGNGTTSTTYSASGAGSTQPPAGSVEEWAYFAGSPYPPVQLTYASICHDAATVTPTTAPTTPPRPITTAPITTTPRTTAPRTTAPRTATTSTRPGTPVPSTARTTAVVTATPGATVTSHRASSPVQSESASGTTTSGNSTAVLSSTAAASPLSSSPSPASAGTTKQLAAAPSGGGGSPTGLIVAALAVVVIGALTGWRILARRRS
jgi:hypothetical protein